MAYNPIDIKKYYPLVNIVGSSNGGIITSNEITSGEDSNLIPSIDESERASGVNHYRKLGVKLASASNEVGAIVRHFLKDVTPGDKKTYLAVGTHRDTEGDLTSPRYYSTGRITADVNAGVSAFSVQFELGAAADLVVQAGDEIALRDYITNKYEILTILSVGWASDVANIVTTSNVGKTYLFANNSICASVVKQVNVTTTQDNWNDTNTASGVYDEATYPLELNHIGCIEQSVTLTFDDNLGNYTCVSDIAGITLGSGNISSDFSPINPVFAVPYFILKNAGFSGTWLTGESITFDIHPAIINLWVYFQVPVSSSVLAPNFTVSSVVSS